MMSYSPSGRPRAKPGILFVSPRIQDGGIERSLEIKAPWLAGRGHRVEVLSWQISERLSGYDNPVLESFRQSGVPVRRLPAWGRFRLIQRAAGVAAIALRGGFRIVVGQELIGNLVAIMANLLLGGRLRVIAELHSAPNIYSQTATSPALLRLARRLYRRASSIIAPSEGVRLDAAHFFRLDADRISAIPYPCRLDNIRRLSRQDATPDPRTLGPYIVACGRLVKTKAFPDLIRAFSLVRSRIRARLVILGEGPERGELVHCAEQNSVGADVLLPGFVSNPYPYFGRARVFVLPSRSESQSLVLVEAMVCGVPVVSSRCQWGPEEVLQGGRCGLLYEVGDVEALATAITRLLEDREEATRLAEAASRRVEDFAAEKVLPRFEDLYLPRAAAI